MFASAAVTTIHRTTSMTGPVRWRVRGAAIGTSTLAVLFAVQLRPFAAAADYLALLLALAVLVSVVASVMLWSGGALAGQVLATGLCVASLVGFVLNLSVGLPGPQSLQGSTGVAGVLAAVVQVLVVGLLLLDAFRRPPISERQRPYAL